MTVSYEQMTHRCQRCARYFVAEIAVCLGDIDEEALATRRPELEPTRRTPDASRRSWKRRPRPSTT